MDCSIAIVSAICVITIFLAPVVIFTGPAMIAEGVAATRMNKKRTKTIIAIEKVQVQRSQGPYTTNNIRNNNNNNYYNNNDNNNNNSSNYNSNNNKVQFATVPQEELPPSYLEAVREQKELDKINKQTSALSGNVYVVQKK